MAPCIWQYSCRCNHCNTLSVCGPGVMWIQCTGLLLCVRCERHCTLLEELRTDWVLYCWTAVIPCSLSNSIQGRLGFWQLYVYLSEEEKEKLEWMMVRDVQLQYVKNVISCLNENKVGSIIYLILWVSFYFYIFFIYFIHFFKKNMSIIFINHYFSFSYFSTSTENKYSWKMLCS